MTKQTDMTHKYSKYLKHNADCCYCTSVHNIQVTVTFLIILPQFKTITSFHALYLLPIPIPTQFIYLTFDLLTSPPCISLNSSSVPYFGPQYCKTTLDKLIK